MVVREESQLRDLIVIKSNYRQIPRNIQAEFKDSPHYTDCRHVIRTEHC